MQHRKRILELYTHHRTRQNGHSRGRYSFLHRLVIVSLRSPADSPHNDTTRPDNISHASQSHVKQSLSPPCRTTVPRHVINTFAFPSSLKLTTHYLRHLLGCSLDRCRNRIVETTVPVAIRFLAPGHSQLI